MTRLIDADYVKEHMRACELNGMRLHIMELEERLAVIDEVPTVDAIPVSYINDTIKWAEENGSKEYAYYLYHMLRVWAERKEE